MPGLSDVIHNAAEQIGDMTRTLLPWTWASPSGIRGFFGGRMGLRFWPTAHPRNENTQVNYDLCRTLYSNQGDMALGSAFAKPIVDLQVSFMGIPRVSTENDTETQFLNECLSDHWMDEI